MVWRYVFLFLRYALLACAAFVICIAMILLVIFVILNHGSAQDRAVVEAATHDFQLPATYQLVSSKYDDQRCLDVCAHRTLTYASRDHSPIPPTILTDELTQLGYTYNSTTERYTKQYDNKPVYISAPSAPADELIVDISL